LPPRGEGEAERRNRRRQKRSLRFLRSALAPPLPRVAAWAGWRGGPTLTGRRRGSPRRTRWLGARRTPPDRRCRRAARTPRRRRACFENLQLRPEGDGLAVPPRGARQADEPIQDGLQQFGRQHGRTPLWDSEPIMTRRRLVRFEVGEGGFAGQAVQLAVPHAP